MFLPRWQRRLLAIEGHTNGRAVARCLLEDRGDGVPGLQELPHTIGMLGPQVAQLHVAFRVDRDRALVGWVLGLRPQLDWIARLADGDLETPGRALRLVREVGADDSERLWRRIYFFFLGCLTGAFDAGCRSTR